jgi:T5SS/PEP-CTERM-associated repeat protein
MLSSTAIAMGKPMNKPSALNSNRSRSRAILAAAAATVVISARAPAARALTINLTFSSNVTSQYKVATEYAAAQYEELFSNPITLNFGVVATAAGKSGYLGESYTSLVSTTYPALYDALDALDTTPDQITAAANLPNTAPVSGDWYLSAAQAVALNLPGADNSSMDGTFMFNTSQSFSLDPYDRAASSSSYDFIGTAEHEFGEIMGRIPGLGTSDGTNPYYLPFDLYRFTSPGTPSFNKTSTNVYFSINNGTSNLKNFNSNSGGDLQDWYNESPTGAYIPDSYNAFSDPGNADTLTPVDMNVMDILGFDAYPTSLSWNGGSGDFLTGNGWSSTGESNVNPFHGTTLTIASGSASHTFTTGETFELSNTNSDMGVAVVITGGTVTIGGNVDVGGAGGGTGSFTQSGGANTISGGNSLFLGDFAGSTGTYTLSGAGSLTVSGEEYIGLNGTGVVNQSGGANTVSTLFYVGFNSGSTGTYSLSGSGSLSSAGNEVVGLSGLGFFNQSGGINSLSGTFNVDCGYNAGATGTYTLSGTGVLKDSGSENIGFSGVGIFNQTGGTDTISPGFNLNLGRVSGGSGTFNLTGGVATVGGNLFDGGSTGGAGGTGNLTVNGTSAALNVAGTITVFNTPGTGLNLLAGTLTAPVLNLPGGNFNQSGGTATFGQITGTGVVSITGGQTMLSGGGGPSQLSSLSISGSGILDITNNALTINYAGSSDPVASVVTMLTSGYGVGQNWKGTAGILSSTAAGGGLIPLLSVGYADGNNPYDLGKVAGLQANQILIRYTLAGDANLDGQVNFADLLIVAQNFNDTGEDWVGGNFTYNPTGLVNFADLLIVAQNFNQVLTPAESLSDGIGSNIQPLTVQVPEPSTLALSLCAAAALLTRRRRRMPTDHILTTFTRSRTC